MRWNWVVRGWRVDWKTPKFESGDWTKYSGAEALGHFAALAARLKPCPCYKAPCASRFCRQRPGWSRALVTKLLVHRDFAGSDPGWSRTQFAAFTARAKPVSFLNLAGGVHAAESVCPSRAFETSSVPKGEGPGHPAEWVLSPLRGWETFLVFFPGLHLLLRCAPVKVCPGLTSCAPYGSCGAAQVRALPP